jgi:EmrB/QacA subfamily drug resistance transporter
MSPENPHHARRWLILAVLGIAQLMVVLDATIVNIALPSAQTALHFSNDNRQWIVTAYSLSFGSLLLLGGKLGDLFGRKWTFVIGLAGFAVASAVGGASQSFLMLAVARACQGAFGALLAPAALSLLTVTFSDGSERNKAFGIYGAIAGSGASVGLLLGGALTQVLSWRYCMYVNLAFAAIAIVGAVTLLHNQAPAEKSRIDIPGVATVTLGLFGLVYGFSHAQTTSWHNTLTLSSIAAGVVLLIAFVAIEARVKHPLLPLRVLADRNRSASYMAMALAAAGMFGVFLFLTYYLQESRGYTPVETGLAFLPLTVVLAVVAIIATTVLRARFGPRILVPTGMALGAIAMLLMTRITVTTSYLTGIVPALILMGAGLGLIFSTAMNNSTLGVDAADAGVASATVNAAQQIGGSLGTALLSTLAASATSSFITVSHPTHALLARAAVHGYTSAFGISGIIFTAGAAVTLALYASKEDLPELAAEDGLVMV